MKHPRITLLYRYWAALKGNSPLPALQAFQPGLLRGLLGDIARLHGLEGRTGYAGSRWRALAALPAGRPAFTELWQPQDRADLARLLPRLVQEELPVVLRARLAGAGKTEVEGILLPVLEGASDPAFIFGLAAVSPPPVPGELGLLSLSFPARTLHRAPVPSLPSWRPAPAAARAWPLRSIDGERQKAGN